MSIIFYTDPNHCKLFRCSSCFFDLFGNIFSVTLYYCLTYKLLDLNIKHIVEYHKLDTIPLFVSFALFSFIEISFHYLFKERDLRSEEVHKNNRFKVRIAVTFYLFSIMIFAFFTIIYVWGLYFDLAWFVTVSVGLLLELLPIPQFKMLFRAYIWSYMVLQYEKYKMENMLRVHQEQAPLDEIS